MPGKEEKRMWLVDKRMEMTNVHDLNRTLVDVNHTHALTQDQCITFFHILHQRTKGAPIPKDLPPDLHAAFAGEYSADLGERPGAGSGARKGNNTPMSKSAQLADSYVNRLGAASTSLTSKGTVPRQENSMTSLDLGRSSLGIN